MDRALAAWEQSVACAPGGGLQRVHGLAVALAWRASAASGHGELAQGNAVRARRRWSWRDGAGAEELRQRRRGEVG